jgi:hypothetical protein
MTAVRSSSVAALERSVNAALAAPKVSALAAVAPMAASGCTVLVSVPACANLTLYRGDDFYIDITVTYRDSGLPADLGTAVATAMIRAKAGDQGAPLASFNATIEANVIHLHLTSAASSALPTSAVWDCQIATPDVTTLVAGTITTTPDVTHP